MVQEDPAIINITLVASRIATGSRYGSNGDHSLEMASDP